MAVIQQFWNCIRKLTIYIWSRFHACEMRTSVFSVFFSRASVEVWARQLSCVCVCVCMRAVLHAPSIDRWWKSNDKCGSKISGAGRDGRFDLMANDLKHFFLDRPMYNVWWASHRRIQSIWKCPLFYTSTITSMQNAFRRFDGYFIRSNWFKSIATQNAK